MSLRLAAMIVAAPFGGLGIFLLWAWVHGAPEFMVGTLLLLLATAIELAMDQ